MDAFCEGFWGACSLRIWSMPPKGEDQWRRTSVHAFGVLQFQALRLLKMVLKWSICPSEQGHKGPP